MPEQRKHVPIWHGAAERHSRAQGSIVARSLHAIYSSPELHWFPATCVEPNMILC